MALDSSCDAGVVVLAWLDGFGSVQSGLSSRRGLRGRAGDSLTSCLSLFLTCSSFFLTCTTLSFKQVSISPSTRYLSAVLRRRNSVAMNEQQSFDAHRQEIEHQYLAENKSLAEVMEFMATTKGFHKR